MRGKRGREANKRKDPRHDCSKGSVKKKDALYPFNDVYVGRMDV